MFQQKKKTKMSRQYVRISAGSHFRVEFTSFFTLCSKHTYANKIYINELIPKPYIIKVVKTYGPTKVDHETHFTHPPSPRTTSSAFPHQPEWQAYEQMRENQLHNLRFTTLFRKALFRTECG